MNAMAIKTPPANELEMPRIEGDERKRSDLAGMIPAAKHSNHMAKMKTILIIIALVSSSDIVILLLDMEKIQRNN